MRTGQHKDFYPISHFESECGIRLKKSFKESTDSFVQILFSYIFTRSRIIKAEKKRFKCLRLSEPNQHWFYKYWLKIKSNFC